MKEIFRRFARRSSEVLGSGAAFLTALGALVIWGAAGPMFGYSDAWQLIVNTATNIITFLMVFLIQYTQNRDSKTMQVKLAELIRASSHARNSIIDLDRLTDEQLNQLEAEFKRICAAEAHRPT